MSLDVHRIKLDAPEGAVWRLYLIGDIHAGNKHCRERELADTVQRISEDARARWVGLGDYGDWIGYRDDKRFSAYECASWLDIGDPWGSTLAWLRAELIPIAAQCLGLIRGNHEATIARTMQFPVHDHLCARLGVVSLGDMAWLRLMFQTTATQRRTRDVLLMHGYGGGRTVGARVNKLERALNDRMADIVVMAHAHGTTPVFPRRVTYINRRGQECSRMQYGVQSGTYLDEAEYERKTGYAPSVIGSPVITFTVAREDVQIQVTV